MAIRLCVAVCCAALLAKSNEALALDPNLTIAQFKHTGWTGEQGAPSYIDAITQSRDGFLWLGSVEGLFRFDGITFEKIPPLVTKPTRSDYVTALLAASTGDVWVGHYWGGVSVYRNGRLMDANPAPPTGSVQRLEEDKFGAVWIWSDGSHFASLRRYADGKWTILDRGWGLPRAHLSDMLVAQNGDLWLGYDHQLAILRHGTHHLEWIDERVGAIPEFAKLSSGKILVADSTDVKTLPADIRIVPNPVADPGQTQLHGAAGMTRMLVDRDNSLWLRNPARNLERIARPRELPPGGIPIERASADVYARKPGLLADEPLAIFEDREGNIWTGTDAGLDRFRSMNIVPVLGLSDYPGGRDVTLVGSNSGRVYGLAYEEGKARPFEVEPGNIVETVEPSQSIANPLCASRDGGAWFLGVRQNELFHVRDGSVAKIAMPSVSGGDFRFLGIETGDGTLWIVQGGTAPLQYNGASWKQFKMGPAQNDVPWSMGPDGQGGALIYVAMKYLADIDKGVARILWRQKDIPFGLVNVISAGPNGALLGGANGLARYDGTNIRVAGADLESLLGNITGIVQSRRGETWILTPHSLMAISSSELDAALDHPGRMPGYRVFDFRDGFLGSPGASSNHLAEAADGRIWLLTSEGYFWIDPEHLYSNMLLPPVTIRSLTADGVVHSALRSVALPSGTSNLQIDYSVLSLQVPERNIARYRLDGVDKTWIDAGSRRQAFYSNLGPGTYEFHVVASNDDDVWNRAGATQTFTIPPTFLQSNVFIVLCALAGSVFLWLLYTLRLRQVTAIIHSRMQERLAERERIARELHDTLLQGIFGLILRFQSVADRMRPDEPARTMMDDALKRADDVLTESRDSVKDLRSSQSARDISDAFTAAGEAQAVGGMPKFRVATEGTVRKLHPAVRDEVTRIGNEAIANAIRHSKAENVEARVAYLNNRLAVTVIDDGAGIPDDVLQHGRQGHFGLTGMRERAERISADFSVASRVGAGTTVTLTVSAAIAYADARAVKFWSWLHNPFMTSRDF